MPMRCVSTDRSNTNPALTGMSPYLAVADAMMVFATIMSTDRNKHAAHATTQATPFANANTTSPRGYTHTDIRIHTCECAFTSCMVAHTHTHTGAAVHGGVV